MMFHVLVFGQYNSPEMTCYISIFKCKQKTSWHFDLKEVRYSFTELGRVHFR